MFNKLPARIKVVHPQRAFASKVCDSTVFWVRRGFNVFGKLLTCFRRICDSTVIKVNKPHSEGDYHSRRL